MPNITITIGSLSATKIISVADMTRLQTAYTALMTTTNPDGSQNVPTNQQMVDRFTASIVLGMVDQIKKYEQANATTSAIASISNIIVS